MKGSVEKRTMPLEGDEEEEPTKVEMATEHLKTLPQVAKRRLYAMEMLQKEYGKLEQQYHEELDALERKYLGLSQPILNKRAGIISGEYEPSELEVTGYAVDASAPTTDAKGVPLFWYYALTNNDTVHQLTGLNERDKDALAALVDIRYDLLPRTRVPKPEATDGSMVTRHGFTVTFTFAANEFFSDRTLVKTYHLTDDESGEPLFDHAEATKPNWLPGKNLTVRVVKKALPKPKHGARGGKRGGAQLQTVEEPCESFFHFFYPPQMPVPGAEMEEDDFEEMSDAVQADFEVGCEIRDNICPKAVLWYNGQAIEEDDEGDMEDYDDDDIDEEDIEDDEDEDEEDDDDEDEKPSGKKTSTGARFNPAQGNQPQQQAPECKQQ